MEPDYELDQISPHSAPNVLFPRLLPYT